MRLLHARILITAHALLTEEPNASEDRIRDVISGNICRCTGYIPIVEAIADARAAYQSQAGSAAP
jgi:aerobic-type carbon monoxide dehydrogenase small subunit (CoxS/CutS family)